jgi:hypothetical protein
MSVKEMVFFSGIIVGNGRRVKCEIQATKTTLPGDPPTPPAYSDYRIIDSDGVRGLPDGDYELLANGERINVRRKSGSFLARPY